MKKMHMVRGTVSLLCMVLVSVFLPIVAFVFDQKGLMFDLSLNGAKITKIQR